MYPRKVGRDMVRKALIHNFGRQLSWWTTLLLALATLVVVDLVVQGVRRVYWPTDQDVMQRIEKDANARRALREHVASMEDGVDHDDMDDDMEMQDLGQVKNGGVSARASLQGDRRGVRISVDDYRPRFTSPAEEEEEEEEREHTWEALGRKLKAR